MTVLWRIRLSEEVSVADAVQFLVQSADASHAEKSTEYKHIVYYDSTAMFSVRPELKGSAKLDEEIIGFLPRTCVSIERVKGGGKPRELVDPIAYEVALRLANWTSGDIFFAREETGVFKRQNGKYLVNRDKFQEEPFRSMLPEQFDYADPPGADLMKANWP